MNHFENGRLKAQQAIQNKMVALNHGYIVSRIGGYKIIEGAGVDAGKWIAEGRGEKVTFKSRKDAEDHARISED